MRLRVLWDTTKSRIIWKLCCEMPLIVIGGSSATIRLRRKELRANGVRGSFSMD